MPKNKQSNSIASVKTPNIGFTNKLSNKGGYSALVNYQSLLSNIFPLAPPIIFTKYRLITSFEFYSIIEFYDLPACKQENCNVIIGHYLHSH